ncbi:MAG TPA: class I SAM-dependent methyltransferase [Opitutus sp.]|nr:class I SAM-dependent methyltransferase [Opitutus sp.]
MNFPIDAFAGTAACYARYRSPYPAALVADLLARAGTTGRGRLLDLACGPGRVTLPLARAFADVWANDLEPEMIAVGKREAARCGVENIRWLAGRAEELAAPDGTFELVTIGAAFHRLDQPAVAAHAMRWLQPGGCLVTLGCYELMAGTETWQRIAMDVVRRWVARVRAERQPAPAPAGGPEHDERVLRAAGFAAVASYPFVERREWTVDAVVGNLYSMSFCSRRVLGELAQGFEAELRGALLAHEPSGRFREEMRFGYTLGRKPPGGESS